MRHVVGKAVMYVAFPPGGKPRTYMERSISAVVTDLLNDGQIVPVAESPVNHTELTEIRDPSLYADVRVVDEETGVEVTLGSVMKQGCRLAHCIVTHAVSGWHMPDQYEGMRRRTDGSVPGSNDPVPMGADEVPVGPRGGADSLPVSVKPPVFM